MGSNLMVQTMGRCGVLTLSYQETLLNLAWGIVNALKDCRAGSIDREP